MQAPNGMTGRVGVGRCKAFLHGRVGRQQRVNRQLESQIFAFAAPLQSLQPNGVNRFFNLR
jgi:hypothetical protein